METATTHLETATRRDLARSQDGDPSPWLEGSFWRNGEEFLSGDRAMIEAIDHLHRSVPYRDACAGPERRCAVRAAVRIGWLVIICSLAACAHLEPRPSLPDEFAVPAAQTSVLDQALADAEARRPGQSAFRLLIEGPEAFAIRALSARKAVRSVDVQIYIWHADVTGVFLAHELIAAADRGVRVRLLIDDLDARAKNAGFAALAAHPDIEVRLFNPFASRSGTIGFLSEGVRSFGRINRRMHNKSWIADNRIAVVGGRNIGDEYFGASEEVNFVDLDFAMFGPIVRDVSSSFDRYWNSAFAYPVEVLDEGAVNAEALQRLRALLEPQVAEAQNSRYASALRQDDAIQRMLAGEASLEWSGDYQFVADDPQKITMTEETSQRSQVGAAIGPLARSAQQSLTIISPYFVPGQAGSEVLIGRAQSQGSVRVLTNSLAANDVAAVHGGYSRYRTQLLKGGVGLWELKPLVSESSDTSLFGSSGASLHTKAFAIDGKIAFVGSYNLDPRSTWLNCEQGVLVESPALAAQIEEIFAREVATHRAWRVTLENDGLSWNDGETTLRSEPDASWGRRFQAWLTRVLRLEAQL